MRNINTFLMLSPNNNYKYTYPMIVDGKCKRCGYDVVLNYENIAVCDNCKELGLIQSSTVMSQEKYQLYTSYTSPYILAYPLNDLQQKASDFILNNINAQSDCLIWAVCGAGKTEITFNSIYHHLILGHYVAFAIPRVDLVYEIYERLCETFPKTIVSLMCGEEKRDAENAQIYVLTTNQLLKFKNAFSLIIVDEVDAFPYEDNQKFEFGRKNAMRDGAITVFLTSTPSAFLQSKKLNTFKIYKRWHNFDLPVPKFVKISLSWFNHFLIPPILLIYLIRLNKQCVIFVSNITFGKKIKNILSKYNFTCEFVYSNDPIKQEKIKSFKNEQFNILIATTILERGITFKNIDVFVLDSSSSRYNIASLVQIAGRVNRNINYQGGKVIFFYNEITSTMINSKKDIVMMNKLKNK